MRSAKQVVIRAGLVLGLLTLPALAGSVVVYSTGFEPPSYALGALAGQDGWNASASALVQSTLVDSGSQSAAIFGDAAGPLAARLTPVDTTAYPIILLQADFAFSDFASGWGFSGIERS